VLEKLALIVPLPHGADPVVHRLQASNTDKTMADKSPEGQGSSAALHVHCQVSAQPYLVCEVSSHQHEWNVNCAAFEE
jgi:hypothetical protein